MKKRRRVDITLHPKSYLNGILKQNPKRKTAHATRKRFAAVLRTLLHAVAVVVLTIAAFAQKAFGNARLRFQGKDENPQDKLRYYQPQPNIHAHAAGPFAHRSERLTPAKEPIFELPEEKMTEAAQASPSGGGRQPSDSRDRKRAHAPLSFPFRHKKTATVAVDQSDALTPAEPPEPEEKRKRRANGAKTAQKSGAASIPLRILRFFGRHIVAIGAVTAAVAVLVYGWYMLFGRYCVVSVFDEGVLQAVRTKEATVGQMLTVASYSLSPEDLVSVSLQQKPQKGLILYITRAKNITVEADGQDSTVRLATGTLQDAVDRSGVKIGTNDAVSPALNTPITADAKIEVIRAKTVIIQTKNKDIKVYLAFGTVKDALNKAGLTYDAHDQISPSLSTKITDGLKIVFKAVDIKTVSHTESIEYTTVHKTSTQYYYGTTKVSQSGKNGVRTITEEVTYRDGIEISRKTVSSKVTRKPVDKIILSGCKPTFNPKLKGLPSSPTSAMIDHTVVMTQITAYTHTGSRTATGKSPTVGMCAIDRRVFSYGTLFYVPGYGYCVAEDTGKGDGDTYSMDVFMDTEAQCSAWGRHRNVTVYVCKWP